MMVNKKRKIGGKEWGERYSVLCLGGKGVTDDLSDCLTFSCTNKAILARNTGIPSHRLQYVFTRLGRVYLHENDHLIIKSTLLFKGNQRGDIFNKSVFIRGND